MTARGVLICGLSLIMFGFMAMGWRDTLLPSSEWRPSLNRWARLLFVVGGLLVIGGLIGGGAP